MDTSIQRYIAIRERQIADVQRFEDILPRCQAVMSELGEDDMVNVTGDSCTGDPKVLLSISIDNSDRLAAVLAAFARSGFRRLKPEPCVVAEYRTRIYDLSDGVTLHIALVGENCKLVEVGTKPVYELVCA
jgi:hypothetical protein